MGLFGPMILGTTTVGFFCLLFGGLVPRLGVAAGCAAAFFACALGMSLPMAVGLHYRRTSQVWNKTRILFSHGCTEG